MNRIANIAGLTVLSLAITACEDIYEGEPVQHIDIPVQLKASVTPFDRDEPETLHTSQSLGVFMTPSDSENGITGSTCMEMVTDKEGNLSRKGIDEEFLDPTGVQKVSFICYTPYVSSPGPDNILAIDVTTPASAAASDYLYAASRNKYPAMSPVKLNLGHILSSVCFNVTPGEGFSTADMQQMTLTIEESISKAGFALNDGTFALSPDNGDITLSTSAQGDRVTGLVIPQQCSLVLKCSVGEMDFHKRLGSFRFEGGHRYVYDMLVAVPGIEITLREIEDWKVEVYD